MHSSCCAFDEPQQRAQLCEAKNHFPKPNLHKLGFSSSSFTVQDQILSTVGDALSLLKPVSLRLCQPHMLWEFTPRRKLLNNDKVLVCIINTLRTSLYFLLQTKSKYVATTSCRQNKKDVAQHHDFTWTTNFQKLEWVGEWEREREIEREKRNKEPKNHIHIWHML